MSNSIEEDPIGHTSKFFWILALLPLIGQALAFAVPRPPDEALSPARFAPTLAALVTAAIGLGVHRRSLLATRIGMVLFGLLSVAAVLAAVLREGARAAVILALFPIWALIKLHTVSEVLQGRPPPAEPR
jgi:hypothetical protein